MEATQLHSTSTPKQWNQADTTRIWQTVCSCIENYIAAWESTGVSPSMADYLPESATAQRRLAVIELIKVDLEYRLDRKLLTRTIEEYLGEFPELTEQGLPLDLVYEEYHLRVRHGEPVNPEEYLRRFPGNSIELRRMLYGDAPRLTSTCLATAPVTTIEVDGQIDDFDILAQLGKGAFATVYLARQRSMQRIVALKVSADRGIEAQTLAQLDHPHIVRVYDQRSLPDRGLRLLYMQYIAGGTLQPVVDAVRDSRPVERSGHLLLRVIDGALDRRGESPPTDSVTRRRLAKASWGETVCWIGARLASALEYAHGHGVLHRDVKPANVLIAADGTPKLVDFNIACCSKVEGATPAAYFGGSLTYMSPEQLEACNPSHERQPDDLDGRSEVYSLGVLLWELASGYRPFIDDENLTNWPQLLSQMADQRRAGVEQQATRHLPTNLPSGLKDVLLRCLQPEPVDRFASAGELARHLELCLRPSAQRLLMPRTGSWRQFVRRHPTTMLSIAAIVPNAVVSVLNATYNANKLISVLPKSAQDLFYSVQIVTVNGTMYVSALAVCIWLCWPVLKSLRQTKPGIGDPEDEERVRERSLWMGDYIAYVALGAWFISGLIYPTWLAFYSGPGQVGAEFFLHFVISQILCGLVSGTLAFFTVTFLAVRALYPALLSRDRQSDRDMHWINSLSQRVWRFLGLSVAMPLLAVAMLAVTAGQQWVFGATSLYGLVGFIASFGLARAIQDDLGALSMAISPIGESLPGETQGFDSLVTESHRY